MKPGNFLAKHESVILGTGFIVLLLSLGKRPALVHPAERNGALLHHSHKDRCRFL